ncbi:MAG: hypothetical protein ACON3Z_10885 [Bradymonadia bacterium]
MRYDLKVAALPTHAALIISLIWLCSACQTGAEAGYVEAWSTQMLIDRIEPATVLPSSEVKLTGQGFVSRILGSSRVRFIGETRASDSVRYPVDFTKLVQVDDSRQISLRLEPQLYQSLCPAGFGQFDGAVVLEVASLQTNEVHKTQLNPVSIRCALELQPQLTSIAEGQVAVNSELLVDASNLLLGGDEGSTKLRIDGCFLAYNQQAPCNQNGRAINGIEIPIQILDSTSRTGGVALLSPAVVGVTPGALNAQATLVNYHSNGIVQSSFPIGWRVEITPSLLSYVDPAGSSLGGFVDFYGSGFVGAGLDEVTEITVNGVFEPDRGGPPTAMRLNLVGEFSSSGLVRYVLNEDDELGRLVDLRKESGRIVGTFGGQVAAGSETAAFDTIEANFRIQPVRQIVYVKYTQGFLDALSRFGLRALEAEIRFEIIQRAQEIYGGLGVEFRSEPPDDYRLYAQVELTGVDPNGIGLIGYDNTPGKDVGNLRLNDQIGGVHALTQQDGYPGYGGVFVESFLSFSRTPPRGIESNPGATELFDKVFSPLRPDLNGVPARDTDRLNYRPRTSGLGCPAKGSDREGIISCAVFAMGNMLGGTMAHEVAHSLGLADPGGSGFHNDVDRPFHLMDAGYDRPFAERASIGGSAKEYFCRENFEYLYNILPVDSPDPFPSRTSCF